MNNEIQEEVTTIATEQHREFMAAIALESDLDFAFRLQLHEAITASLAVQPNDVVSKHETLKLKDNVITEFETKRIKVSDDGASTSKTEEEVYRVYFKGLVSEERIGVGKSVTLAGIGVAICDSRDVLVYDMKKDVEIGVGDRVSRRSVEEMALIEALNFAVSLGALKRIVLCFDYHTLYQYVSGRWQPKQHKIKSIVDQVNLIRKSFTDCELSFVAQKDVKFALKLAREAINSQIEKAVESSRNKRESCVICLDEKSMGEFFLVEGCNHQYCYSCMKQHAEVKLLHGMVPKCPHEGCEIELRIERCQKFLTPKLTEMMRQQLKEASIPVTEKVYCPYPKCSTLMSKTELLQPPIFIYENGARTCHKCHGNFCVNCRVPWHKNMNCADYKRVNPTPLVEESKLKNLAAKNLWRQCIKCNHMIELAAGCYHMTCRCGYEFCYTCGAEWKNKKATCSCPIWDEENIIDTENEDEDDDVEDLHNENDDDEENIIDTENEDEGNDVEDLHNENFDDDVEVLHNENDDDEENIIDTENEDEDDDVEDLHNENFDDEENVIDTENEDEDNDVEDLHNENFDDDVEVLHNENDDDEENIIDTENEDEGNDVEDLHNENFDDEENIINTDNEDEDDDVEDLHNENFDDEENVIDTENEDEDNDVEDLHNENDVDEMYDDDDEMYDDYDGDQYF